MGLTTALGLFAVLRPLSQHYRRPRAEPASDERPPGNPAVMKLLILTAIVATTAGLTLAVQSRNAGLEEQREICGSPGWDHTGPDLDDCVEIRSDIGSEGAKGILFGTSALNLGLIIGWGLHLKYKLKEAQQAEWVRQTQHARAVKRERLAGAVQNGIIARIDGAVALGGSVHELSSRSTYSIIFTEDAVHVMPDSPSSQPLTLAYETLAIAISGQGERTTNLGLWGGGFGLKGAAKGMLAASVLNSLTTRTDIDTVVALSDASQELYFHYDKETPDSLRMRLASVFVKLRSDSASSSKAEPNLVTDLSRLVELRDSGALSEEEFAAAKQRLLAKRDQPS